MALTEGEVARPLASAGPADTPEVADSHILTFRDGAHTVTLRTDPHMQSVARQLFPDYLAEGAPNIDALPSGPPDIDVTSTTRGYRIRGPVPEPTLGLDVAAATDELERRLATALLSGREDCFHLHSAALATEAGAILVLGPSGAGKSTIAFRWLLSGRRLLGDDVVTIGEGGVVRDFRRRVKVDVARVIDAEIQPDDTVLWRPGYDECWIDPARLGGWGDAMAVRAIVWTRFDPSARVALERVPAATGLAWLLDSSMDLGVAAATAFPWLVGAAELAPAYSLVFDDAGAVVTSLAALTHPTGPGDGGHHAGRG